MPEHDRLRSGHDSAVGEATGRRRYNRNHTGIGQWHCERYWFYCVSAESWAYFEIWLLDIRLSEMEMKALRDELNGQHLRIAILDDFPLSYRENNVAKGVAFQLMDFLTQKFNFTFDIVSPSKEIMGSKHDFDGSVIEMLNKSVSTPVVDRRLAFQRAHSHPPTASRYGGCVPAGHGGRPRVRRILNDHSGRGQLDHDDAPAGRVGHRIRSAGAVRQERLAADLAVAADRRSVHLRPDHHTDATDA